MAGTEAAILVNPFVGPRPLETGEPIFGRERDTTELYYLLSAERIVLLYSPSGAGKSSLIQAGLVPRMRHSFDVWRPTRVNTPPPASVNASANRYVLSAIAGFEQGVPEAKRRPIEDLQHLDLAAYVSGRPRRGSAPSSVLLIFDQFEEVLTVDPLAVDAKREFFDQLGDLLHSQQIWALFAMREDYLAPFDPYAHRVPTHLKNRYRIDRFQLSEAGEAIARPAMGTGRSFAPDAVERLVQDLARMKVQQPDGTFIDQTGLYIEPLQLQVVCRGLWDRMRADDDSVDLEDVERFGNVNDALAAYYAAEVGRVADGDERTERSIREWVGDKLITPDGIRGQVLKGAGRSEGLENALIGHLIDRHLVRAEHRAGAVWFELAHDRLMEPVRRNNLEWREAHLNKLQKDAAVWEAQGRPPGLLLLGADLREAQRWAEQNRTTTTEERFLTHSAQAAAAAEREKRQAQRLRITTVVSVVLMLLAFVAVGVAVLKTRDANAAAKRAKLAEDETLKKAKEVQEAQDRVIGEQAKTLQAAQEREILATATGFVADFGASGVQSDDAAKLTPAQGALLWKLVTTYDDRQISAILRAFLSTAPNALKVITYRESLMPAIVNAARADGPRLLAEAAGERCTAETMKMSQLAGACSVILSEVPAIPPGLVGPVLKAACSEIQQSTRAMRCLSIALSAGRLTSEAVRVIAERESRELEHALRIAPNRRFAGSLIAAALPIGRLADLTIAYTAVADESAPADKATVARAIAAEVAQLATPGQSSSTVLRLIFLTDHLAPFGRAIPADALKTFGVGYVSVMRESQKRADDIGGAPYAAFSRLMERAAPAEIKPIAASVAPLVAAEVDRPFKSGAPLPVVPLTSWVEKLRDSIELLEPYRSWIPESKLEEWRTQVRPVFDRLNNIRGTETDKYHQGRALLVFSEVLPKLGMSVDYSVGELLGRYPPENPNSLAYIQCLRGPVPVAERTRAAERLLASFGPCSGERTRCAEKTLQFAKILVRLGADAGKGVWPSAVRAIVIEMANPVALADPGKYVSAVGLLQAGADSDSMELLDEKLAELITVSQYRAVHSLNLNELPAQRLPRTKAALVKGGNPEFPWNFGPARLKVSAAAAARLPHPETEDGRSTGGNILYVTTQAAAWLPDAILAHRLRTYVAAGSPASYAGLCGKAPEFVADNRPITNRFLIHTVLRWPDCTPEDRRELIRVLGKAKVLAPFGEQAQHLPYSRVLHLLRARGYDMSEPLIPPRP